MEMWKLSFTIALVGALNFVDANNANITSQQKLFGSDEDRASEKKLVVVSENSETQTSKWSTLQ